MVYKTLQRITSKLSGSAIPINRESPQAKIHSSYKEINKIKGRGMFQTCPYPWKRYFLRPIDDRKGSPIGVISV
jgi:hypothetical protein